MPDARSARLDQLDDPRQQVGLQLAHGLALTELGRLQEAASVFDAAAQRAEQRKVVGTTRRDLLLARARLALLREEPAAARALWQQLSELGDAQVPIALALSAELEAVSQGPAAALAQAERHLAAFDAGPLTLEQPYARVRLLMVSAQALLALDRPGDALAALDGVQRLEVSLVGSAADRGVTPPGQQAQALRAQAEGALKPRVAAAAPPRP
jgi:tetratricopeptide (TPR) repeat protein